MKVIQDNLEIDGAVNELTKENVQEKIFDAWLEGFKIYNPDKECFSEMQTDDCEL